METTKKGDTHFETESLTNLRSDVTVDLAADTNRPAPPAADRDRRLRELEEQLSDLQKEVRRLRQEK